MSAAIRITPEMISFLKKKLTGTSDDSPDTPPKIAPTIRTSDIPVTDSLPPEMPNTRQQGFSTPEVGYQAVKNLSSPPSISNSTQMPPAPQIQTAPIINKSMFDAPVVSPANEETRPRIAANPANTLANNYRNQPLETDTTINNTQPTIRPYQSYNTVPSSFGGNAIPIDAPVIAASRERTTQPISPLLKASENAAAPVLPDFGQDKEGNQRTHAKRGFLGRSEAFVKDLGINLLDGRGLIPSAIDAGRVAANPDILAERRAKVKTAENQREFGNQIALQGEQEKIADAQSQRRYRDAQTLKASQPKVHYAKNAQGQPIKVIEGGNSDGSDKVTILDNSKKVGGFHTTWGDDGVFRIYNEETRQFEPAHDENGQVITSELKKPIKLKIGDETFTMSPNAAGSAAATADRFKIEKDIEGQKTANDYAIRRAQFEREEADRVRREQDKFDEDTGFVEDAQRRISELKKEQAENDKVANDSGTHQAKAGDGQWYAYPNQSAQKRAAATTRSNQIKDEIGRLEGDAAKHKPVKPKPAQPFPDVQLTIPSGGGVSRAPRSTYKPKSDPEGLYN